MKIGNRWILVFLVLVLAIGCGGGGTKENQGTGGPAAGESPSNDDGDDDETSPGEEDTTDGDGNNDTVDLDFDCVIMDYTYGYGVEGEDDVDIVSVQGPERATVESPLPGTYAVEGTYRLTNYDNAIIELGFAGTASIANDEPQEIVTGEGDFSVGITLIDILDGSGYLIISMAGDDGSGGYSQWMFDALPSLGDWCNP